MKKFFNVLLIAIFFFSISVGLFWFLFFIATYMNVFVLFIFVLLGIIPAMIFIDNKKDDEYDVIGKIKKFISGEK